MLVPAALDGAGLGEEEAAEEEGEEEDKVVAPLRLELLLFVTPATPPTPTGLGGGTRRSMVEKAEEGEQVVVPMAMPPLWVCFIVDELTAAAAEAAPAAAPSPKCIMGAPGGLACSDGEGEGGE